MIGKVKQTGIRDDILYAFGVKEAAEVAMNSSEGVKDVIPGRGHPQTKKLYP